MRITFVLAAADLSGGNRVISIYAQRLASRGHQVTVVSRPRRTVTLKDKFQAWWRGQSVPENRRDWPSHFDGLAGAEHRQIRAALPPNKGRKAYFIQHYEAHPGQDSSRVDATWRLPMHKIIIAQWLVATAKNRFGDGDVSFVPNAVDLQQFNAPPRGKQAIPTVGVMYSIVPFKGCDISLKAFEIAKKNVPDLKLVAFGNRSVTTELPLPPGSDFTRQPAQDQIRNIYARCDAWLVGSRSEGFGLPILEAMACRTPVIATPTGAAPELTAPGGGMLVGMEDPQSMAQAIERIVGQSDDQWQAMSDIAHATATRYTWDDAMSLFEAALARSR